jgi:hypothetical protein
MEMFEADVRAFLAWWVNGERKRRAQRTGDQYVSWIRKWRAWNLASSIEPADTPTIQGCRAFVAEVRARSEWNAFGATRALKAWS